MGIEERMGEKTLTTKFQTWWALRSNVQRVLILLISTLVLVLMVRESFFEETEIEGCPHAPLQVFILAGQNEMLGHAAYKTLHVFDEVEPYNTDLYDANTGAFKKHPVQIIQYNPAKQGEKKGNLSVGYGATTSTFGPELSFGITLHKHIKAPILLLKYAWDDSESGDTLENYVTKENDVNYQNMIRQISHTLDADGVMLNHMLGYDPKQGFQIRGLVWYSGMSDFFDHNAKEHYTYNLGTFTQDLMKKFKEMYNDRANFRAGADVNHIPLGEETGEEEPMFAIAEFPFLGEAEHEAAVYDFRQKQYDLLQQFPTVVDHTRVVRLAHLWDYEASKLANSEPDSPAFKRIASTPDEKLFYGSGRFTYRVGQELALNIVDMLKKYEVKSKHQCLFHSEKVGSTWW